MGQSQAAPSGPSAPSWPGLTLYPGVYPLPRASGLPFCPASCRDRWGDHCRHATSNPTVSCSQLSLKPVTPPPPPRAKSSSPIVHFHGTACLSFGGLSSVVKNHYLCICLMSVSPENSRPHEDRSPIHLVHRCIPNTERSA